MMSEQSMARWDRLHMRLSCLVREGRSDLRNLRNVFGLAAQGKGRTPTRREEQAAIRAISEE